jgi:hypothetical protein
MRHLLALEDRSLDVMAAGRNVDRPPGVRHSIPLFFGQG